MLIAADAQELQGDLARLRHDLHREPEIGLELPRTQEKVLKALDGLPFEVTLGKSTTSVTAVLRGTAPHASATKPAFPVYSINFFIFYKFFNLFNLQLIYKLVH